MTKKNFKAPFDSLLGEELPKEKNIVEETRATFIVKKFNIERLKAIAYWERKAIKDVLDEALNNYIQNYEETKGPIQLPKGD